MSADEWWAAYNRGAARAAAERAARPSHSAEDYTDAELAEIRRAVSPSTWDRATDLWIRPIQKQFAVMSATMDKPLAELTMPEALAWFYCLSYAAATGFLAASIAFRILGLILGPRR